MKEGQKLYFVDTAGNVSEHITVNPPMQAPCRGCDLLVKDKYGHIYSGDSKSYLKSKAVALKKAKETNEKYLKSHLAFAKRQRKILKNIESQLNNL